MGEEQAELEKGLWEAYDQLRGELDVRELPRLALLLLAAREMAPGGRLAAEDLVPDWSRVTSDSSLAYLHEALDSAQFLLSTEYSIVLLGRDQLDRITAAPSAIRAVHDLARLLDTAASTDGTGEVTDRILEYARRQGGVESGEHTTPPELRALVVELAGLGSGGDVYDPACGTASLLVDVCQRIAREQSLAPRPFGQDVNARTASVARVNLLLHGLDASGIRTGDTIGEPAHVDGREMQRFGRIVSVLPLGVRISSSQRELLLREEFSRFELADPGTSGEAAFVLHALASLADSGTAIVVLSSSFLFRSGQTRQVREALIREGCIRAAISLPPVFANSRVRPALLILQRTGVSQPSEGIQFVSTEGFSMELGQAQRLLEPEIERIGSLVRARASVPGLSAVVDAEYILSTGASLAPSVYTTEDETEATFAGEAGVVRLGEVATITAGTRVKAVNQPTGGPPVIRGRDLRQLHLGTDDLATAALSDDVDSLPRVESGDILIQRIGEHPAAMLVGKQLAGAVQADTVIRVRFHDTHRDAAPYVVDYLNSQPGQAALARQVRGTAAPYVLPSSLSSLWIPVPSHDLIRLAQDLRDVEADLLSRVARARDLREQLFELRATQESEAKLVALDAEQRTLSASLLKSDDQSFQIRNFYPYPLSFPYRMLGPIDDPLERYMAQLTLAESLLAYLGSLGLSLIGHVGRRMSREAGPLSIKSLDEYWRKGTSPGDWEVLGRETGRALRGSGNELCEAFSSLWFKGTSSRESQFAENAKRLVALKNDFKHDRGPKIPPEYERAVDCLQQLLDDCFGALGFMVAYPLYLTGAPEVDPMSKEIAVPVLNCSGDHPAFARERHEHHSALPRDTLFIATPPDDWVRLFPLITAQYCPTCRNREFFFIDRWDGRDCRLVLKSFERGHTMDTKGTDARAVALPRRVGEGFRSWLAERVSDDARG